MKRMYSIVFCWSVLNIYVRSICSNVSFKVTVFLLIFCLDDLSIYINGVLKPFTIIILLLMFSFMSVNGCFIYFVVPYWVHKYNCFIFFLDCPLYYYMVSFFVSCCSLCFKAYLSDISIVTLPSFHFHLHDKYFSIPLLSECVFMSEVSFL